jgi:hypothetical protein
MNISAERVGADLVDEDFLERWRADLESAYAHASYCCLQDVLRVGAFRERQFGRVVDDVRLFHLRQSRQETAVPFVLESKGITAK